MTKSIRARFWLEAATALIAYGLGLLTIAQRDWIEALFRVHPDAGSGLLEWSIVGMALAVAVLMTFTARREWRRRALAA